MALAIELIEKMDGLDMSWHVHSQHMGVSGRRTSNGATYAIRPDKFLFIVGIKHRGIRISGQGYGVDKKAKGQWHSRRDIQEIAWVNGSKGFLWGCRGASIPHYDHDFELVKRKRALAAKPKP